MVNDAGFVFAHLLLGPGGKQNVEAFMDYCREAILPHIYAHALNERIGYAVEVPLEFLMFEYGVVICQQLIATVELVVGLTLCHS